MVIRNAKIALGDDEVIKKDIYIKDGIITDYDEGLSAAETEIDATGLWAVPGLVDIHLHGAVGHDFCDANEEGLKKILDYEASRGIAAIMPATMTLSEDVLNKVIDTALKVKDYSKGAAMVGINMEGPFISKNKVAAQNPDYIIPANGDMFERLMKRARGLIKMIDLAPENMNNMDFIKKYKDKVIISLAHTDASYEEAKAAFDSGALHLTHMFNAMNGINHRAPGPILASYEAGANVELICDGVHIHDAVIRMVFDLFDEDRIVLVSDSMMATGLSDGQYTLGGQEVIVAKNRCTLKDNPNTIAGSNTNLFECMRHAIVEAGIPIHKAVKAASINPARELGIDNRYGNIKKGCYGNVILADEKFNIKYIITRGIITREMMA